MFEEVLAQVDLPAAEAARIVGRVLSAQSDFFDSLFCPIQHLLIWLSVWAYSCLCNLSLCLSPCISLQKGHSRLGVTVIPLMFDVNLLLLLTALPRRQLLLLM